MITMMHSSFVSTFFVFINFYWVRGDLSITLLHTNDIHSRIEETDQFGSKCQVSDRFRAKCYGGIARLSTAIKTIRKDVKNVILLDGGDQQTGTLWYDVYQGNATVHFINKLRYDAMVLGNHDFDGGVDHVVSYLRKTNTSVILSNVDVSGEPSWPKNNLFYQSLILTVGGEKVGLCGYLLKNTPRVSKSGQNIKFNDEVTSTRNCVTKLVKLGVNKIVALGHSGIQMDKQIAEEVDNVDVVVGGHTNTFLYTGPPPSNDVPAGPYPIVVTKRNGKKCLVVQAFAYTKYLGRLNVTFDSVGDVKRWTGNPVLLDQKIVPDADVLSDIARMKSLVDKVGKVKIGQSLVFLDGKRRSCRIGECILGNLVTDAAIFDVASRTKMEKSWTGAAIALWTANSIMASIEVNKTGYIMYEDILNAFPYNNKIDIVDLSGAVLHEVLEKSALFYNEKNPSGFFLQVSGLRVTMDTNKNANNRVIDVDVRCADCPIPVYTKLNKTKIYKVIISSYMASGAAGYEILRTKRLGHTPGATRETEAIVQYIKLRTPLVFETGNRLILEHSSVIKSSGCIFIVDYLSIYIPFALVVFQIVLRVRS